MVRVRPPVCLCVSPPLPIARAAITTVAILLLTSPDIMFWSCSRERAATGAAGAAAGNKRGSLNQKSQERLREQRARSFSTCGESALLAALPFLSFSPHPEYQFKGTLFCARLRCIQCQNVVKISNMSTTGRTSEGGFINEHEQMRRVGTFSNEGPSGSISKSETAPEATSTHGSHICEPG